MVLAFGQVKADDLAGRVAGLQEEVRAARNEASALRVELAVAKAEALIPTAVSIGDSSTRYYSRSMTNTTITLTRIISTIRNGIESKLFSEEEGTWWWIVITRSLKSSIKILRL